MCVQLLQSCPTLCNLRDCSPPGSSIHGILQARILEWVATPSSRGSSRPRDQTHIFGVAGGFLTAEPPGKLPQWSSAAAAAAKSLQLCLTLCNPIDGSPPGFSIHGIFQARVLEWGAIAFSITLISHRLFFLEVSFFQE